MFSGEHFCKVCCTLVGYNMKFVDTSFPVQGSHTENWLGKKHWGLLNDGIGETSFTEAPGRGGALGEICAPNFFI